MALVRAKFPVPVPWRSSKLPQGPISNKNQGDWTPVQKCLRSGMKFGQCRDTFPGEGLLGTMASWGKAGFG
jgi:hypothetical protein